MINQYTRLLTLPLAVLYSAAYVILLARNPLNQGTGESALFLVDRAAGSDWPTITKILFMSLILTAGAMVVMWLAELITERGIGNGSSIMITIGIISAIPSYIRQDFTNINVNQFLADLFAARWDVVFSSQLFTLLLIFIGLMGVVYAVVFISESARKIDIQYARSAVQTGDANLPLKLTVSGVMPMIFASALLAVPQVFVGISSAFPNVAGWFKDFSDSMQSSFLVAGNDAVTDINDLWYALVYFLLIIAFGVFYAFIAIKPEQTAENLQKSGAFIPGIRPGIATQNYIVYVLVRIAFAGSVFLGFVALVPIVARLIVFEAQGISPLILSGIGGTSILIVVSVVIDILRQFNSLRVTRSYSQYTS